MQFLNPLVNSFESAYSSVMDILFLGIGSVVLMLAAMRWGADTRTGIEDTRIDRRERWTII